MVIIQIVIIIVSVIVLYLGRLSSMIGFLWGMFVMAYMILTERKRIFQYVTLFENKKKMRGIFKK